MSPWLIGFTVFVVYPMVASLYFSFTHYDLLSTPRWIGLDNYIFMFTEDSFFWQSVRNTVWIVAVGVSVRIVFAIATAMLLTRKRRGRSPADLPSVWLGLGLVIGCAVTLLIGWAIR